MIKVDSYEVKNTMEELRIKFEKAREKARSGLQAKGN